MKSIIIKENGDILNLCCRRKLVFNGYFLGNFYFFQCFKSNGISDFTTYPFNSRIRIKCRVILENMVSTLSTICRSQSIIIFHTSILPERVEVNVQSLFQFHLTKYIFLRFIHRECWILDNIDFCLIWLILKSQVITRPNPPPASRLWRDFGGQAATARADSEKNWPVFLIPGCEPAV